MKKFIALFLVFSLLVISCTTIHPVGKKRTVEDSSKQKRGAELVVQKKDGQQLRGELIAVKKNSLLLLSDSGVDVSINVGDIRVVKIVKRSELLSGAGSGLLIGGAGVGGVCALVADWKDELAGLVVIFGAALGAGIGLLIGGISGAAAGTDETIQIEGESDLEIKGALEKLRKKARVPDYK